MPTGHSEIVRKIATLQRSKNELRKSLIGQGTNPKEVEAKINLIDSEIEKVKQEATYK